MPKAALMKRKLPPSSGLQRRVRARREEDSDPELVEKLNDSDEEDEAPSEQDVSGDEDEDEDEEDEEDEEEDSEPDAPAPKVDMASISFGALAKAQASMPKRRRKGTAAESEEDEEDDEQDDRHSKRGGSKFSARTPRSSKHAPMEVSSKKRVSRKREILPTTDLQHRDPRFDPTIMSGGPAFDEVKAKKAYAFLDQYRDSELADLKATVKKTKDPELKERLKRQVLSIESKRKAEKRKEDERRVIAEHRRREKELVAQGKTPFYLKKSEQKKRLLTEQFKGMKKRDVDKAIERKRKKVAGREKKELDQMQRRT